MTIKRFETQDGISIQAGDDIVDSNGDPISVNGLTGNTDYTPENEGDIRYSLDINNDIKLRTYQQGTGPGDLGVGISLGNTSTPIRSGVISIGNNDVGYDGKQGGVYIGYEAGWNDLEDPQGEFAIAIGARAARNFAQDNSITLNATGVALDPTADGLYIKPVREIVENTAKALYYNTTTGEVTYADPTGSSLDTNVWVETFVSDTAGDNVQYATSVEYDSDGNIVALFRHEDTNADPVSIYTSVAKFDTAGNKLWSARLTADLYTDGWGLAVDSQAVYIAGRSDTEASYDRSMLIKLNTINGNFIWLKTYDFNAQSFGAVVDVASDGHPVMVGYAYFDGEAYVTTTKVDKDTGEVIWSRKLDGQNGEYAYGMAIGPSGEVVVIGYMDNVGVLDAAATLYTDPVSNPNWTTGTGIFISGEFSCTVSFVDGVPTFTNIVDYVGNRTVDGIIGTINGVSFGGVTGVDDMILKVGSVTGNDTADKMLVVKYDSTGTIAWQKAIEFDEGVNCAGADADIDSAGNIYVCGTYTRPDGEGPWNTAMSLIKLEDDGTKVWSRRVVGDCEDFASSVVVGPDNCLYLSGITGTDATDDYTFVIAKYSTSGQVLWQRLLDNTATWSFGSNWFQQGGGSNIAVKDGYVAVSGAFGDPGSLSLQAFIAQVSSSGTLFATGDWDFKGASFSGILNNTASDITVTAGGKTDSDNSSNITTDIPTFAHESTNFLVTTRYGLSIPIGDLTVVGNTLRGTGSNDGFQGLNLAPGPDLDQDMYFRIHGGDNPTHLHLSVGDTAVYDQYFGNDGKYLKLGLGGAISIGTNDNVWEFSTTGKLTIPGAVVNSTVTNTVSAARAPLYLGDSTYPAPLVDGNYGPFTRSDIVFTVQVVGGSPIYTITSVLNNATFTINQVIGTLDAGDLGGTPGNTSNIDVSELVRVPLNLTKSVNKLADGPYSLADGIEGQIMHLVPQTGIDPSSIDVIVANYRIDGSQGTTGQLFPFRIFNDADSSYYNSRAFCTLIFTDGAWQQQGGSWD